MRADPAFAETLSAALAGYGPRPCIEFEGRWRTGDQITGYIDAIGHALGDRGPAEPVALVVRNRVPHAAAIPGSIADGRPVLMVYSYQSAQAIARDIQSLSPAGVIADPQDWSSELDGAVRSAGAAGITLGADGPPVATRRTAGPVSAGAGLDILSSGTTGAPKRVHIPTAVLAQHVRTPLTPISN